MKQKMYKIYKDFLNKRSPPITFLMSYHLAYQCLLLVICMPVTYRANLDNLANNTHPPSAPPKIRELRNTAKTQLQCTRHEPLPACILKALIKG